MRRGEPDGRPRSWAAALAACSVVAAAGCIEAAEFGGGDVPSSEDAEGRSGDVASPGEEEPGAGEGEPNAGEPASDAGEPAADAAEPAADAGEPAADAGEPAADAGEPVSDAGETVSDAGETVSDAGETVSDAGETVSDAGETVPDALSPEPDAVSPEPDAPSPDPDAPSPVPDAPLPEPEPDAGTPEPAACVPDCTGKVCGPDGCGGTCGTCPFGQDCLESGSCFEPPECGCTPDIECGDDPCGNSCGACPGGGGSACIDNTCISCQEGCSTLVPGGCGVFQHPDTGKFICDCGPCEPESCDPPPCSDGACGAPPNACGGVDFCGPTCGFGTCGDDQGHDLVKAGNGNLLAVGTSCGGALCEPYLLEVTPDGEVAGHHLLGPAGGAGKHAHVLAAHVHTNGKVYLAGYVQLPGDSKRKGLVLRLSATFAVEMAYVSATSSVFESVLLPLDGKNPIAGGFQESGGAFEPSTRDPWVVRIDESNAASPVLAWQWVPDEATPGTEERITGLGLTATGQIVVVGQVAEYDNPLYTQAQTWIMKPDCCWIYGQSVGSPDRDDAYEDVVMDYAAPLGYWAVGWAETFDGIQGLLVRYDLAAGSPPKQGLTLHESSSPWPTRFHGVCRLADGSLGIGGALGTGFTSSDAWLLRFDPKQTPGQEWLWETTFAYDLAVSGERPDAVRACLALDKPGEGEDLLLAIGRIQQATTSDPAVGEMLFLGADPETGEYQCQLGTNEASTAGP